MGHFIAFIDFKTYWQRFDDEKFGSSKEEFLLKHETPYLAFYVKKPKTVK